MAKKKGMSRRGLLITVGVAAAVGVLYFGWANSYLGARLAGRDVATRFTPLVRHVLASQKHCYDDGSTYCERYLKAGGQKEFTVAYLLTQAPSGTPYRSIFGCFDTGTQEYYITQIAKECRGRRLNPFFFGYIPINDNFESATELLRCYSRSANNYLVTDDRRECELSLHTDEITSLGYAAAAGHLPQRRLEGLCAAAKQAGVLADAYDGYCRNLSKDTAMPTPGPSTPTPKVPAPVQSWQNPKNKYDVDGDGSVSPIDVVLLINLQNSNRGSTDLVKINPVTPPFVDVSGDKHFSPIDITLESQCLKKGGTNC